MTIAQAIVDAALKDALAHADATYRSAALANPAGEKPLMPLTISERAALTDLLGGEIMATPDRLCNGMAERGVPIFGQHGMGDMTLAERSWVSALCAKYASVEADLLAQGAF